MDPEREQWTAHHISQRNPRGAGQGDVPALLRRTAHALENHGPLVVQDVVLDHEITDDGVWPQLTVYFTQEGDN